MQEYSVFLCFLVKTYKPMYWHTNLYTDLQTYVCTYKILCTDTLAYVRTLYVRTHKHEYGHVLLYYTTVGEFVIED